jgi:hypothetical protein
MRGNIAHITEIFFDRPFLVCLVLAGIALLFADTRHFARQLDPSRYLKLRARWWQWHLARAWRPMRQRYLTILNVFYLFAVLLYMSAYFISPTSNSLDSITRKNLQTIADRLSASDRSPSLEENVKTMVDRLSSIEGLLARPTATPSLSSVSTEDNGSGSVFGSPPSTTSLLALGFIVASLAVTFVGFGLALVYLFDDYYPKKRAVYAAACGLVGIVGAIGTVKVPTLFGARIEKLFSFEFSLPKEINISGTSSEQSITIYVPEIAAAQIELECANAEGKFQIGPFPDGFASRDEMKAVLPDQADKEFDLLNDKINHIIAILTSNRSQNEGKRELVTVLIIGSADKRGLVSTRQLYGSNDGLAQGRARWVQQQMQANAVLHSIPTVTLNSGASLFNVAAGNISEHLAPDRSVQVCGLWQHKR